MTNAAKVGYLGPQWSFTYLATRQMFPNAQLLGYASPRLVFRGIEFDEVEIGILPVENSIAGPVTETLQLLAEQPQDSTIKIIDEHYLPIDHYLAVRNTAVGLNNIEAVLTNEVVFDQCRLWLERYLPKAAYRPFESTAQAAEQLKDWCKENNKEAAIIGPREVAEHYGLSVLSAHIQDQRNNTTRFLALSKKGQGLDSIRKKITLVLILQDRPGSLARVLQFFAAREINLANIKMTPVRTPAIFDWKDWFVLDLNAPTLEGELKEMFVQLLDSPDVFVVKPMGVYPDRSFTKRERAERILAGITKEYTVADTQKAGLKQIVARGESHTVEFKSTLRWNKELRRKDSAMEMAIARSIAGFMNTDGGLLLIGVGPDGTILGIQEDFPTLKETSADAYYQALMQTVENYLGLEFGPYVKAEFEKYDDRNVCACHVSKSPRPVFTKLGDKEELFVRIGNTTRSLNVREADAYISDHWHSRSEGTKKP